MMKNLLLLGFILGLSSCAHTPIRTLPEHITSISIPIFTNQTFQYGLEEIITNMVIEEFIRDGRLNVVDKKLAQAELKGEINHFERIPFSYDKEGNIAKYKITIGVSFGLTDLTENKPLWDEEWEETILYIPSTSPYRPGDFDITSEQEAIYKALSKIAYYLVSITIKR
ncbi:MAG: LptE family protein [bacterium]